MKRKCCYLKGGYVGGQCDNPAEYEIANSESPADTTDACVEHVGPLLSDAPRHSIVRISESGETQAEHCRM